MQKNIWVENKYLANVNKKTAKKLSKVDVILVSDLKGNFLYKFCKVEC